MPIKKLAEGPYHPFLGTSGPAVPTERWPIKMTHYMTRDGSDEVRVLDMTTGESKVLKCACGRKAMLSLHQRCKSCDASYWEGFKAGVQDAKDQIRKLLGPEAP